MNSSYSWELSYTCYDLCITDWASSCHVNNGGCAHFCQQTTIGARCTCRRGYVLDPDGRLCNDVNECSYDNACSQICNNTIGSYHCSCAVGYVLRPDGHGCKAEGKPVIFNIQYVGYGNNQLSWSIPVFPTTIFLVIVALPGLLTFSPKSKCFCFYNIWRL